MCVCFMCACVLTYLLACMCMAWWVEMTLVIWVRTWAWTSVWVCACVCVYIPWFGSTFLVFFEKTFSWMHSECESNGTNWPGSRKKSQGDTIYQFTKLVRVVYCFSSGSIDSMHWTKTSKTSVLDPLIANWSTNFKQKHWCLKPEFYPCNSHCRIPCYP